MAAGSDEHTARALGRSEASPAPNRNTDASGTVRDTARESRAGEARTTESVGSAELPGLESVTSAEDAGLANCPLTVSRCPVSNW